MDFNLTEEETAALDLAHQILGDKMTMERHMAIESGDEWFDRDVWAALATAGLLGISLGEDVGGGGLDFVAAAVIAQAQGTHVAPIPYLPSTAAALVVDRFGDADTRQKYLPGVADGSTVLTFALQEHLDDRTRIPSATKVRRNRLHGEKIVVEYAAIADAMVVSADTMDGRGLFLINARHKGVTLEAGESTRGEPVWKVSFASVPITPIGPDDGSTIDWLADRVLALLCNTQLGVTEQALKMTAEYTSTREQFGRPIATFQAVTQRLADQYINVGGIRLSTLAASWKLGQQTNATEDLLVAKWWASERAVDIAHATQHCHGGMGVAKDYPLHRYTLWNKHITHSLGAATQTLRELGRHLADASS